MQKAVLDTNILVSAMLSINGNSAGIVNMALNRELSVYYNSGILFEYDDVLYRPRFDFNTEKVKYIIGSINEFGIELTPDASDFPMIDESDNKAFSQRRFDNESSRIYGTHFTLKNTL